MPSDASEHALRVADDLESQGYAIVPAFVPPATVAALRARVDALDAAGELRTAGVGRGAQRVVDTGARGDRIRWIDPREDHSTEQALHAALDAVRLGVNRVLALGLFDVELHYALYPPGTGYAPHVDRFRDDDARVLSCVLYLNEAWTHADGGALRLHLARDGTIDVLPVAGTLVAFLSARFLHEVLPARRTRYSVTGWFRRRALPGC